MTNEVIIFNNSMALMKEGILKGSGNYVKIETNKGLEEIELPEEIHTFNGWKARGYQVKKGAKSFIKFSIWKYVSKKAKEDNPDLNIKEGEELTSHMFLKESAFFTSEQVEKVK